MGQKMYAEAKRGTFSKLSNYEQYVFLNLGEEIRNQQKLCSVLLIIESCKPLLRSTK
jgi:hypothetical protein